MKYESDEGFELAFKYAQASGDLRSKLLCLVLSVEQYVLPHMADDDWRKEYLLRDYDRARELLDKHREDLKAFLNARDLRVVREMH